MEDFEGFDGFEVVFFGVFERGVWWGRVVLEGFGFLGFWAGRRENFGGFEGSFQGEFWL